MVFEWDEKKNKYNIAKHGVSFATATKVFLDPKAQIFPDPFKDEERWDAVGLVEQVLFVVFTERDGDKVRIISARKANKEEIYGYKNNDFRRS